MEVVRKQSIQSSAIQIVGSLIGALSTVFIYPMDLSLYGIYGFLTNTASLLVPFISLGFGSVLLRFFPYFDFSEKKHFGFFGFVFSGYAAGILLFTLVFILLYPLLQTYFSQKDPQSSSIIIYILPVTILYVVFDLFTNLSVNFQKITVPAFFVFIMKIFLPLIFMLSVMHYIDRIKFVWLICFYYIVVILLLVFYLRKTGLLLVQFNRKIYSHPLRGQMYQFALYSILGGASAILALRMDSILITSLKGTEANGLFTLAIFISNVAFIPASAITESLNAVVSSFSKGRVEERDNGKKASYQSKSYHTDSNSHRHPYGNVEEGRGGNMALQDIYSKSSRNMLIPTLWISVCIYCGFIYLSQMMPNSNKVAFIHYVVGWLLLARIIDAATGVNHHILAYSKYYRFELYLLLLMAVLNIYFNYLLIPQFGIPGAAFATFSSICLYNILKTILVYFWLGIHPISPELLKTLLLGFITAIVFNNIHLNYHPAINILITSVFITLAFPGLVYYFRWSIEFNDLIDSFYNKFINISRIRR